MSAATSPKLVTLEEWAELEAHDHREFVDGVLEEAEVPDLSHAVVHGWLSENLRAYFRPRGGIVAPDLKIAIGQRRGRLPDTAVYASARPPGHGLVRTPPEIIIEIVSPNPSDQRRDRIAKVDDYAALGARQYWIVDPSIRAFEIYELREQEYARVASGTDAPLAVPGFEGLVLDLPQLWAELDELPPEEEA